ncbi:MAG: glycosyltransferase, partial [Solirubrobacterales bacterium]
GVCTVFNPPIADQLPVYVQDNYEHFEARTFDRFDDSELEFYVNRNVMAVREVVDRARPDFGLANHMIMGPYILRQALGDEIPYVAKIHGSAMEYIVRPHPRFLPFAREGVGGARAVLVGSRHIAERTWDTLKIPGIEQRIWLGPPGVDVERFKQVPRSEARAALSDAAAQLRGLARAGYGPAQEVGTAALYERVRTAARVGEMMDFAEVAEAVGDLQGEYRNDGIDQAAPDVFDALAATPDAPIALYVGKLIVSKGVDLLAAAWPLVRARVPDAQLLVTGFGAYREGFEMLVSALSDGDLPTVRWIAEGGRAFEGGEPHQLEMLMAFLDGMDARATDDYLSAARGMRDSIRMVGRLEHDLLAPITPAADCQVVPSTFPEAFGMVAAEAAACGVPPVSADHSGLAEVTATLQEGLSGVSAALLSFPLGDGAVEKLGSRIHHLLTLSVDQRIELSARIATTAQERFSWAGVAADLIAAAEGDTGRLRRP